MDLAIFLAISLVVPAGDSSRETGTYEYSCHTLELNHVYDSDPRLLRYSQLILWDCYYGELHVLDWCYIPEKFQPHGSHWTCITQDGVTVKIFFRYYQETLTPFDREVDDGHIFPHLERRQSLPPLHGVLHRLGW